jgi:RNA polymerase sigma factor (sigma-70 family)
MSEAALSSEPFPRAGISRVLPDDRLVRRAVAGDERAFAAIFDRYHQRLYRYCTAIVGNPDDAQDAFQNTMVKVMRALPGEQRQIDLKPWLYRIAHNESIELIRRRHETRELDPELTAASSGLAEDAATRERLRGLLADLDELPERQRGALVMRELAGLGFAEIAIALGTSQAVTRQTLYEARRSLRQMAEGREMGCDAVTRALSDGDGRVARRRDLRAHLRECSSCRGFREEIEGRQRNLSALSPLPAAATAGLLQGLFGGGGGAAGGGLASGLGGAVKSLGAATALKGAATVAVVAVIGVGVADRGGLIGGGQRDGGGGQGAAHSGPSERVGVGAGAVRPATGPGAAVGVDRRVIPKLGASGATRRAIGSARGQRPADAGPGTPTSAPVSTPFSQGKSSVDHPSGRGHEKQLPAASAHGQETAATHKAAGHGSSAAGGHPAHPTHSAHPVTPAQTKQPKSGAEKAPAAPKDEVTAPPTPAHGNAGGTDPVPDEAPEPETDKKP